MALTELDIPSSSPSRKKTPMKKPSPAGPRTQRNPPPVPTTKKSAPGSTPMKGC